MQILALDIGTDSVKAAVLETATSCPLSAIAEAPCEVRKPAADAAEAAPENLWSAVTAACRHACRDFPGVQGIGLSVRSPALVLLDKADLPLCGIWTPLDRRARPAARQVWAAVGQEFLQSTGNRPLPGGTSAVCYRQQLYDDPYLCHHVRRYLHLNGWLALRMTGERAFDRGNASLTGLFGTLKDRQWSRRWCDYFEVDTDWLPPVVCGSATIGTIRSAVAAELGVTAGIPLKLGTVDPGSAMLAVETKEDGLFQFDGDLQMLATIVKNPQPSPRVVTRLLGVGDPFIQIGYNAVGREALEWIRRLCFLDQSEAEFWERTLPAASQRSTRVLLDPAHLAGAPLEIEACRAAFRDLTLAADRMDLLAAVLGARSRGERAAREALGLNHSGSSSHIKELNSQISELTPIIGVAKLFGAA